MRTTLKAHGDFRVPNDVLPISMVPASTARQAVNAWQAFPWSCSSCPTCNSDPATTQVVQWPSGLALKFHSLHRIKSLFPFHKCQQQGRQADLFGLQAVLGGCILSCWDFGTIVFLASGIQMQNITPLCLPPSSVRSPPSYPHALPAKYNSWLWDACKLAKIRHCTLSSYRLLVFIL